MQRMALIEQRVMQHVPGEVQVWHQRVDGEGLCRRQLMRPLLRWLALPPQQEAGIRAGQSDHSLTHAGNSLFAMAVKASGVGGVGIDFEPWRVLDKRHQRLMLTGRESALLPNATARQLLQIWTVKEACFKADCGGQQRWVTSYELLQPTRKTGLARVCVQRQIQHFRYISMEVPGGILSVAFKMES